MTESNKHANLLPSSRVIRPVSLGQFTIAIPCIAAVLITLSATKPATAQGKAYFDEAREAMIEEIRQSGATNKFVIEALARVPRHEFVPLSERGRAYFDMALPIGSSQTISSPFIVAYMTAALNPKPTDKILEIGTGSGYQAAVLGELVKEVYTIEIIPSLGRSAMRTLKRLHYDNVHVKIGDGYEGWPEHAPFDKIIVTCSPEKIPPKLFAQLKEGGIMVIPVGERYQQVMYQVQKIDGRPAGYGLRPTLFVPMTGQAEDNRVIQPDPSNPQLVNGGFEDVKGDPPMVTAWYYQRQMKIETDDTAPEGKRFVTFTNEERGRASQALQGLAVDGRKVKQIEVSLMAKGKDIYYGQDATQLPRLSVTFYDERRSPTGTFILGPWRDEFQWRAMRQIINVPPRAREAIIHIGLSGATGEISFDDIKIRAIK